MKMKKNGKKNLSKRIKSGISIKCFDCSNKEQIPVNEFYCGKARCSNCGGSVERVYPADIKVRNKLFSKINKKQSKRKIWKKKPRTGPKT